MSRFGVNVIRFENGRGWIDVASGVFIVVYRKAGGMLQLADKPGGVLAGGKVSKERGRRRDALRYQLEALDAVFSLYFFSSDNFFFVTVGFPIINLFFSFLRLKREKGRGGGKSLGDEKRRRRRRAEFFEAISGEGAGGG